MYKNSVSLFALFAFAAVTLSGALPHDSAAQENASKLRRLPAQIQATPAQPVKPSRPQTPAQMQVKKEIRPAPGKLATPGAAGGPDTPGALANLVVIPFYGNPSGLPEGFPTHSYCVKKATGGTPNQIRFYIRNAGGSDSGSFQWTPSFPNAGAAPAMVVANIPANGQVAVTQGIPDGCYTPGFSGICQFSIHLDDHDEVEEWSEANTYGSFCVSPAG
jgi:hypothetical protein